MINSKILIPILIISILAISTLTPSIVFAVEDGTSSGGGFNGSWDEDGNSSGGGFDGSWDEEVDILEILFSAVTTVFSFALSTWQRIEIFKGITIWNIMITAFIIFGIIRLIITKLGAGGISNGINNVVSRVKEN